MTINTKENNDLQILQREYRNMEANRRAFAEESHLILRKQQQTIDKLRLENETLKSDIAAKQTNVILRPVTSFEQSIMDRLFSDMDKYNKLISQEQNRISCTLEQTSVLKDKLWHHRRTMGGVNAARDNQRQVEKQVRILENRLDQALVKFNKSIAYNKKLRQKIDDLRSERSNFESVQSKLEKELYEKKKQMAHVIEQSNLAYEQRDKAHLEITAIEQTNKKEEEAFEQQMKEYSAVLETELKFMPLKRESIASKTKDSSDSRHQQNLFTINADLAHSNMEPSSQQQQQFEILQKQQEQQKQSMERIQNFEEAFRKISAATGISDIDELVQAFIANEEQNFSLFSYSNEQSEEIEKLEAQVQELKAEEARYRQDSGKDESQYENVIQELDEKILSSKTQMESFERKCNEHQKTIQGLKSVIQNILQDLDCKTESLVESALVTDTNLVHFLGVIEERTNEILLTYHNLKSKGLLVPGVSSLDPIGGWNHEINSKIKSSLLSPSILGVGPSAPMGREPLSVHPPKCTDYSSEEESSVYDNDVARPLTREEMQGWTPKVKLSRSRTKAGKV